MSAEEIKVLEEEIFRLGCKLRSTCTEREATATEAAGPARIHQEVILWTELNGDLRREGRPRLVVLHIPAVHGTATVALRFDDRGLEVSIANPVDPGIGAAPSSAQGNGFGLIGMRERIEAVGGTLVVDRASDGR